MALGLAYALPFDTGDDDAPPPPLPYPDSDAAIGIFDFITETYYKRALVTDPWVSFPFSEFTFTRNEFRAQADATGLLIYVSPNVTVPIYNPTTLAKEGYQPCQSFTNLLLRAEAFNNATWVKTDTTVVLNTTVSPDGFTSSDTLTEGVAGTGQCRQDAAVTSGETMNFSMWLQRGNHDWVAITVSNTAFTSGFGGWVNIATGATGVVAGFGTGTFIAGSFRAEQWNNGWYRVSLAGTIGAFTTARVFTTSATADGSSVRVANGARIQFGAQLTQTGQVLYPYAATSTVQVTSPGDELFLLLTSFGAYTGAEGTLLTFSHGGRANFGFASVQSLVSNADSTTYAGGLINADSMRAITNVVNASVAQAVVTTATGTLPPTQRKQASAWKLNDVRVALDGSLGPVDNLATIGVHDRILVGGRFDQQPNFPIRLVVLYPAWRADPEAVTV